MRRLSTLAVVVLLLTASSACAPVRMALPDGLPTSEPMSVQGRQGWRINQRIRFGPYATERIDRSWTRGRDLQILAYDGSRRNQSYGFLLREGGEPAWEVACTTRLRRDALAFDDWAIALREDGRLLCEIQDLEGDGRPLRLTLISEGERPLRGTLEGDHLQVEVRGTNRLAKGLPLGETSGYHLRSGDRVLGAVQVINAGTVWLSPHLTPPERGALAALAAALLALEDLRAAP